MLQERFSRSLLRNLRRVREDVLERAERADELLRGLLADAPHPRDVVRAVADEGEKVGHECGWHAEPVASVLDAHPLLLDTRRYLAPRVHSPDPATHQLLQILLARTTDLVQFGCCTLA